MLGAALGAAFLKAPLPAEAREVEVGAVLPPAASNPGFVFFRATSKDTPALRAGKCLLGFWLLIWLAVVSAWRN